MFRDREPLRHKKVAQAVEQAMQLHGLTQPQLAEKLGCEDRTIRQWLEGRSGPRLEVEQKLARLIGERAAWFHDDDDNQVGRVSEAIAAYRTSQSSLVEAALRRVQAAQEELSLASKQLTTLLGEDFFRPPGFRENPESAEKVTSLMARMEARERAHADGSSRNLPAAAREVKRKPKKDEPGA